MKGLSFFLIALVICFISCRKEVSSEKGPHCQNLPTKYITTEITNFKFKKGTYWVYVDSVSLAIDTMRVDTVLADGIYPNYYCPDNYNEFYSFKVNPKNIFSKADAYSLREGVVMRNQRTEDGSSDVIYGEGMVEIDSVFIYDRFYKHVVAYTKSSDPSENLDKTTYYSNAEYGFLKKVVYNSSNQLLSKKLLIDKLIIR